MEQFGVSGGVDVRQRAGCFVRTCLRMQLAYNFIQTSTDIDEAGGQICDVDDCEVALGPMSGEDVVITAGQGCYRGNDNMAIDYGS